MASLQQPYAQSVKWSTFEAHAVLAVMKAVATLNGARPLDQISREMLMAVQKWVFQVEIDIDSLPLLSPTALAEKVQEQRQRQQALQLYPYRGIRQ